MINKTIAALIALFFSLSINAQVFVQVTEIINGIPQAPKFVQYVPGVTTGGITQAQLDAAVSTRALQSFVVTQLGTKANVVHRHNASDIDGLSTTGGTTTAEGQLIALPDQKWYKIIQPTNYGATYSNGSRQGRYFMGGYKINPGINFSTPDRPDNVFTIAAYNTLTPNGNHEFPNEAAWDETVETHYDNSGYLPYGDFEWHQRVNTTDGHELRNSWYVNKTNGQSRRDWSANVHQFYFPRAGKPDFLYGVLQESTWNLYASSPGRIVGYIGTDYDGKKVGIWQLGGEGFAEIPGFLSYKGYGKATILPNVISPTGLVSKESYWKTITVNGETFEVLTRVK